MDEELINYLLESKALKYSNISTGGSANIWVDADPNLWNRITEIQEQKIRDAINAKPKLKQIEDNLNSLKAQYVSKLNELAKREKELTNKEITVSKRETIIQAQQKQIENANIALQRDRKNYKTEIEDNFVKQVPNFLLQIDRDIIMEKIRKLPDPILTGLLSHWEEVRILVEEELFRRK